MNSYAVIKLVKTLINIKETLIFSGFTFSSYSDQSPPNILIQKNVQAEDFKGAERVFLDELLPILDSISILTQTIIHPLFLGSGIIFKLNDNSEGVFIGYYAEPSAVTGLFLNQLVLDDVNKLLGEDIRAGISYLKEAISSYTGRQQLLMFFPAVESFAGNIEVIKKCSEKDCTGQYSYNSTDKGALKNILTESLYKTVYKDLRHKLVHGVYVHEDVIKTAVTDMYNQIILKYLKEKYSLSSVVEIPLAPRSFLFGRLLRAFRMNNGKCPDLRFFEENYKKIQQVALPIGY